MMKIVLVTIGYNLPGMSERLIDSAVRECQHDLKVVLFSHSSMPDKKAELKLLADRDYVIFKDYGNNRGLSKSWNEGILEGYYTFGADVVVVANEDSLFGDGDLSQLAEAAMDQRDRFLVTGRCYEHRHEKWTSSEYGCFAFNPMALNTLGCFDENFFPVYCEDADFRARASLAGLEPGYCDTTNIEHGGSLSLREPRVAKQNEQTFAGNIRYFQDKWGGVPGSERFSKPFDDKRFTHYIDPRVREAPYLGFNRTDQHLVKF